MYRLRRRRGFAGNGSQPKHGEAEIGQRQRGKGDKRLERVDGRHAARRLVEQDLDVPAQRQKRAPDLREAAHGQDRKTDAREAEGGRTDDAGQAEAESEVARQQLEKRAEREIGDDEQTSGGSRQHGAAAERHLIAAMNGEAGRDQEEHEDAEVRRELADQGGQRIAAGRLQPFAEVARAELRSHGIARGYGDHDVQDGRQDRAQQELGVVQGGIGQHVLFDDQRTGRIARRRRRRQIGGAGRHRGGQAAGRDVAGRKILLVVEDDDLRPLARGDVALEVARQIDRRERRAGTDGVHGRVEVGRSPGDVHARRGIQGLDIGHRRLRRCPGRRHRPARSRMTALLKVSDSSAMAKSGTPTTSARATRSRQIHRASRTATLTNARAERRRHQGRLFQSA